MLYINSSFKNSLDSILIYHPRGIQNIYILQIIRWQAYETVERREKEIKKRKEWFSKIVACCVSQTRRAFTTPPHERCILNVAWRKLFQKDRKCAREWTTAPKLNITSQSFVECAAIYSVSLADPVYINRSYFALMIEPILSRNILRKVTRLVVFFSSSTLLPCIPTRKRDDFQGGKFNFQSL